MGLFFGFLKIFFDHFELSKGDGTVVALDEMVVFGDEALALGGAGVAVDGDIFLDEFSVEVDREKAGFFEEFAFGIEARGSEFDDEFLPLASGLCGVDFGSVAFESFRIPLVIPAVVDGSHVAIAHFGFAVAIEDLDLVAALKIDAGI